MLPRPRRAWRFLLASHAAQAGPYQFNGYGENQNAGPFYYVITGNSGKLPASQVRNGDNATGGTMRFVTDDPAWGHPTQQWQKDDWFPQTAGLALTLKNGGSTVYDNNGIDDGSYGNFYNAQAQQTSNANTPGLYRGYSMVNNWDWIYASYFELTQATTFDTIVGYFDLNSDSGLADFLSNHGILMSLWSETTDGSRLPVDTGSFVGDVFSTATSAGTFSISDTGVDRVFDNGTTDDIYRVEYRLNSPLTLDAGGYYFSNAAAVAPEPSSMALLGSGVIGLAGFYRRRRAKAA